VRATRRPLERIARFPESRPARFASAGEKTEPRNLFERDVDVVTTAMLDHRTVSRTVSRSDASAAAAKRAMI